MEAITYGPLTDYMESEMDAISSTPSPHEAIEGLEAGHGAMDLLRLMTGKHCRAREVEDKNTLLCHYGDGRVPAYVLHSDDHGRLVGIDKGPMFSARKWAAVFTAWQEEIKAAEGDVVGQRLAFSSQPKQGAWRDEGQRLQVLPMPEGNPQPHQLSAYHPFLIQFRKPKAVRGFVAQYWSAKIGTPWEFLLGALLPGGAGQIGGFHTTWVIARDPDPKPGATLCRQVGYRPTTSVGDLPEFSRVSDLPALPDEEGGFWLGHPCGPAHWDEYIEGYLALQGASAAGLRRGLYWYAQHQSAIHHSRGAGLVLLANALEALYKVPPPGVEGRTDPSSPKCKEGRRVSALLRRWIPDLRDADEFTGDVARARNDLVHGDRLMWADQQDRGVDFDPLWATDWVAMQTLSEVTKEVLRAIVLGRPSPLQNPGAWSVRSRSA